MALISFPTGKDISIEVNGRRVGTAQGYKVKTTRESRYVEAFGSSQPIGTIAGQERHLLQLSRVMIGGAGFSDGIDFYGLEDFNVVISKPGSRVIYSGCQWSQITQTASVEELVLEEVTVVASKRMVMS